MRCEAVQENLKAFCDGELKPVEFWRVRRHVRRCPSCEEELALMQRLNTLLLSADIVPHKAPSDQKAAPRIGTAAEMGGIWRRPRAQWAGAGAVLLAAVVLTLSSTGRSDALAAVMQALAQMKTWKTCHLVTHSRDGTTSEQWVRVRDAVHEEVRRGGALTSVTVQNAHESWLYQADKNMAVHSRVKLLAALNGSTVGTVCGPLYDIDRLQQEAKRVGGLTIRERRDRMPDGRAVRVIDVQIDMAKHYQPDPGTTQPKARHDIVYLDAQSAALLRWEAVTDGETFDILSYDEPVPDTLFTWQPPAGVKVVEFPDWWEGRRDRKLAIAANKDWEVMVHAVDVAANGDVWLTASERRRSGEAADRGKLPLITWAAYGMTLTDERGRVYVQFLCQQSDAWPRDAALIGFTPLDPRRESDPFPNSFTASLWPEYKPSAKPDHADQIVNVHGLTAPSPSGWVYPSLSPWDVMTGGTGWSAVYSDRKERARRAYHEGNVW
jgi:hypothetical protein